MKRYRYESRLIHSLELSPTVKHLVFECPDEFEYQAGMFMSILFPQKDKFVGRSYSLASIPTKKKEIEFCVRKVERGFASEYLFDMNPGDILKMMGPMGKFFIPEEHLEKDIVFVATGTGIAPFRGMILDLLQNKKARRSITLIAGYRYEEDLLYNDEFKALEKDWDNFSYWSTVSRPRSEAYTGERGWVQPLIEKYCFSFRGEVYYLCGLEKMLNGVKELLTQKGVSEESVIVEQYN